MTLRCPVCDDAWRAGLLDRCCWNCGRPGVDEHPVGVLAPVRPPTPNDPLRVPGGHWNEDAA